MPGVYGRRLCIDGTSNSAGCENLHCVQGMQRQGTRSRYLMPALFIPNALAAPFTFEKANRLSLIGIEKLVGLLKVVATRRAVEKPILRLCLLLVDHAPFLSYRG
jgi:hypothetical protein